MIQQHCYVMKDNVSDSKYSSGITKDFAVERLLPLCFYHPSKKKQALRVPAEEFPKTLIFACFPEGKSVICQTVYTESGFFVHQYVADKFEKFDIYNASFMNGIDQNQKLQALAALPQNEEKNAEETVGPLPFDEARLLQLAGVLKNKLKAYVILPDLEWVRPMLMWLHDNVDEPFGFVTHSRETIANEFLNLIFIEKGSLQVGEPSLGGEFVFDFDSGSFSENLPN